MNRSLKNWMVEKVYDDLNELVDTAAQNDKKVTQEQNVMAKWLGVQKLHFKVAGSNPGPTIKFFSNFHEIFCICLFLIADHHPGIIFSYLIVFICMALVQSLPATIIFCLFLSVAQIR